ncbi:MAG: ACP S-malonyltransferase [Bacteroidota bacterium]|nr:ACP S-malonyltransferase [Bacteroidota bacterium]
MKAFVFPGQGAQFSGMGKDLHDASQDARMRFEQANDILGFDIASTMFEGTAEQLKQTKVTQPAIFLHSVILAKCLGDAFQPNMVAGHSLGEFSALVAAGALGFEDGLSLVSARANAMQKACELQPSTMAAVLGLENTVVEDICGDTDGVVVAANYNCPGQLVISGEVPAVEAACHALTEAGARRALMLPVGGAFHSPLMEPAREELATAIAQADIQSPRCPIYQNVSAEPTSDPQLIRQQLVAQLTAPVRWTQTMEAMIADGAKEVTEVGPGKVLQGLFKKVDRAFPTASAGLEMA